MIRKKIIISLFTTIISFKLLAIDNNKNIYNNTNIIEKTVFNIESNAKLTVALLDKCWENRENEKNQKIIANYLMTKPTIPNNFEIAWKMARLIYFIGNYGIGEQRFTDTKEGVKLFEYGYNAGIIAKKIEPKKVEGYYWYAINLGSYGLAKGILSAAKNASAGMDALKEAQNIDPEYHWYGSSRILGRYYQELPSFFGGDDEKSLNLFKIAIEKAPQYNNNWVFLGKFYNHTKNYESAIYACNKALSITPVDGKYENKRFIKEANLCIKYAQKELN
jgi:tetratricopeptide (TPR) repeat protein